MEIQPTNNGKGDGGRLEGFDVIKTFGLGKPTGIAQYQEIAFPKCGYLIEPNGASDWPEDMGICIQILGLCNEILTFII